MKSLRKNADSPAVKFVLVLGSVLAALIIGALFISCLGVNVIKAYEYLLIKPFTSLSNIGEITIKLVPILTVAIGVSFSFNAKLTNLGGEGQMYMGALGMTLIGTSPLGHALGMWSLPIGLVLGALMGGCWACIAGFFKTYFRTSEIITTLLLNYIAVQLISFLVYNPLRDPAGNIPQSEKIAATLPKLFSGMRTNAGLIIAAACVLIYWIVIRRTKFGYHVRALGGSIKAAGYSGVRKKRYYLIIMLISGAFAGLAGAIELAGTQTRLLEGLAGSYGFDGIVVALLGMLHPVYMVVAAIFMSSLSMGAELMQVKTGVPSTFLNILEALIVLFILLGFAFSSGKLSIHRKKSKGGKK